MIVKRKEQMVLPVLIAQITHEHRILIVGDRLMNVETMLLSKLMDHVNNALPKWWLTRILRPHVCTHL